MDVSVLGNKAFLKQTANIINILPLLMGSTWRDSHHTFSLCCFTGHGASGRDNRR